LTRLSSVMPIAANEAAGLKFLRAIEPAAQIAKQK